MINRFVFNGLRGELFRPEINILLGPRQVGKTTLLKKLKLDVLNAGKSTVYFDLEEPDVLASFNRKDQEVVDILRAAGYVVFIDVFLKNIQYAAHLTLSHHPCDKVVARAS